MTSMPDLLDATCYGWYECRAAWGMRRPLYLRSSDLSGFNAKAPPPHTAFWRVVAAGEAPESGAMRDVTEALGNPDALTLSMVIAKANERDLQPLDQRRTQKPGSVPHPERARHRLDDRTADDGSS